MAPKFNQIGREFPMGGMNDKGLVVELMWLEGTRYPKPDERPVLMELQWIQYQLDNLGTVDEVLACQSQIRIVRARNFDFSADTPSLDLTRNLEGNVSGHFVECKTAIHKQLLEKIFKIYKDVGFVKNILSIQLQFPAGYPDTLKKVR